MINSDVLPLDQSILVEFGEITPEQRGTLERHPQRAWGPVPSEHADRNVYCFTARDGQTSDEVYDDIRGWAIGHAIPIIRHIDR